MKLLCVNPRHTRPCPPAAHYRQYGLSADSTGHVLAMGWNAFATPPIWGQQNWSRWVAGAWVTALHAYAPVTGWWPHFSPYLAGGSTAWACNEYDLYVWNGSTWALVMHPADTDPINPEREFARLIGFSSSDVWLLSKEASAGALYRRAWNGSTWSAQDPVVITGYVGSFGPVNGATGVAGGPLWATVDRPDLTYSEVLRVYPDAPFVEWTGGASSGRYDQALHIAALSATDVLVCINSAQQPSGGVSDPNELRGGWLLYYDGATWSAFARPTAPGGQDYVFLACASVGPADRWVVGYVETNAGDNTRLGPLVAHYDGSGWTRHTLPGGYGAGALSGIYSISAPATDDVWIAGSACDTGLAEPRAYVAHWDGAAWTERPLPP